MRCYNHHEKVYIPAVSSQTSNNSGLNGLSGKCYRSMGVRRGVQNGRYPLEMRTMTQKFIENLKSEAFRLIDLILALTVYLAVWHSHCTRTRITILLSYSDELAFHSCSLLCLQRQVTKLASGLLYRWSLLRNNNMPANVQRFASNNGRRFAACGC